MMRMVISIAAGSIMAIFSAIFGIFPGNSTRVPLDHAAVSSEATVSTMGSDFVNADQANTLKLFPPLDADAVVTIRFANATFAPIDLYILDLNGRRVRTLVQKYLPTGHYEISWFGESNAAKRLSPGVYLLALRRGPYEEYAKIVLN